MHLGAAEVFILDEPTRGIEVGARAAISHIPQWRSMS
jgi:ABC-type sugar transport system ATPase subunit